MYQLAQVKPELDEDEKLLLERQKHKLLADKSESGVYRRESGGKSDDEKRILSAERRAHSTLSTLKKKRSTSIHRRQKSSACTYIGSLYYGNWRSACLAMAEQQPPPTLKSQQDQDESDVNSILIIMISYGSGR